MFSGYLCIDEVKKDKKVFAKGGDETNNEDMESDRVQFTEKTKDELIDIILGQNDRIRELEEKVEAEQKKRKKRPGRKKGHEGITRRVPEEIDETVDTHGQARGT